MDGTLPTIPLASLLLAFAPSVLLLGLLWRWRVSAGDAVVANLRMLAQLLLEASGVVDEEGSVEDL